MSTNLEYFSSALDNGKYISAFRELFKGRDLYTKYIVEKITSSMQKKNQIDIRSTLKNDFKNRMGQLNLHFYPYRKLIVISPNVSEYAKPRHCCQQELSFITYPH